MLVKKYGNRRLYDTESSRYITLEELTEKIRAGAEARVIDAKTNRDLTQETLTQIIIESRGADTLFPATLLHQLIRLGDDALAEFLGRYVQGALELYLQARKSTQSIMPFNPLLALNPFLSQGGWMGGNQQQPPQAPPPPPPAAAQNDVDTLRRELDELKASLQKRRK
ncbi:MAG: polyhydroxyalkanoate synthesis regulator DNA-binding domain-containing protein [Myxococcaceae bacterium]